MLFAENKGDIGIVRFKSLISITAYITFGILLFIPFMITKWYAVRYDIHEVLSIAQFAILVIISGVMYGLSAITMFYGYLYAYVHGKGSQTVIVTTALLVIGFLGALVGDQLLICFLIYEDVDSIAKFIELRWMILSVSGLNLALWTIAAVLGYAGARQIRIAEGERKYIPTKRAMDQLERKDASRGGWIQSTKAQILAKTSNLSNRLKRNS
jgi:hypothetical protein